MKTRNIGITLIFIVALALIYSVVRESAPSEPSSATSGSVATTTESAPNQNVARLNETIELNGVNITPIEIVEDSRCPVDVTCIQAGTVRLRAKVSKGAETQELILGLAKEVSLLTGGVTLSKVVPAKQSTVSITNKDYSFEFLVR